jgi:hypothetical protein
LSLNGYIIWLLYLSNSCQRSCQPVTILSRPIID